MLHPDWASVQQRQVVGPAAPICLAGRAGGLSACWLAKADAQDLALRFMTMESHPRRQGAERESRSTFSLGTVSQAAWPAPTCQVDSIKAAPGDALRAEQGREAAWQLPWLQASSPQATGDPRRIKAEKIENTGRSEPGLLCLCFNGEGPLLAGRRLPNAGFLSAVWSV